MLRATEYYSGHEMLVAFDSVESVRVIPGESLKITTKSGDKFEIAMTLNDYLSHLSEAVNP